MAQLKITKLRGTVGNKVYRIVNGKQVVSSLPSYISQPNTEAQMTQRCKWPNVIAMYRAFKPYAKKCFEYKAKGSYDYSRFVSVNVTSSNVYLTKELANQKAGIVAPYLVSQGSLDAITVTGTGSSAKTDISLGSLSISTSTTVADFATAVVTNNSDYKYEDQVSFLYFAQSADTTTNVPIIKASAWRVSLSLTDTSTLLSVGGNVGFATKDGYLGVSSVTLGNCGFCWVHSRKTSGGKTLVSSQKLIVSNTLLSTYTTEAARLASMQSYGLGEEVFITPDGTSSGSDSVSSGGTGSSGTTEGGGSDSSESGENPYDPFAG